MLTLIFSSTCLIKVQLWSWMLKTLCRMIFRVLCVTGSEKRDEGGPRRREGMSGPVVATPGVVTAPCRKHVHRLHRLPVWCFLETGLSLHRGLLWQESAVACTALLRIVFKCTKSNT